MTSTVAGEFIFLFFFSLGFSRLVGATGDGSSLQVAHGYGSRLVISCVETTETLSELRSCVKVEVAVLGSRP